MRFKQNHFTNLVTYGIGQAFNLVTPILVAPYIVYVCGLENYGTIGVGMAVAFLLIVLVDFGSDLNGVKEIAVNRDNKEQLSRIVTGYYSAKAVMLIAVLAVALAVFSFVPYFEGQRTFFILSLPIVVGQFVNPTWVLQGIENLKAITFLTILSKIIYVAGIFLFIKTPDDYIYVNLWWGIGMITAHAVTLSYFVFKKQFEFLQFDLGQTRKLLRSNYSMASSQVFVSLQLYAPIVLISYLGNDKMAGQYRIVEQVLVVFKTYLHLFFNYVYPRVCYLLDKSRAEAMRFWKIYNGINFAFIAVSMAAIYILADVIVLYFNHSIDPEIVSMLRFGTMIPLAMGLSIPLKQLLLGRNLRRFYIRVTMIMVILALLGMALAIPVYSVFGVLASLAIAEFITIVLFALAIKNKPVTE